MVYSDTVTRVPVAVVLKLLTFLSDNNDLPWELVSHFETHYNGKKGWGPYLRAQVKPTFPQDEDKHIGTIQNIKIRYWCSIAMNLHVF